MNLTPVTALVIFVSLAALPMLVAVGLRLYRKPVASAAAKLASIFKYSWNMPGVDLPAYKAPRFFSGAKR